jgi:hypothetical protein
MPPHPRLAEAGADMTSTLHVRIRVRSRLGGRLAGAFEGLTLVHEDGGTELTGALRDQAHLHGLLAQIRDLGLDLESVSVVDPRHSGPPSGE